MILPIDVSKKEFDASIKEFKSAIGEEWVFTNEDDVGLYRDAYSSHWDEPDEPIPSIALAPASVEEVQAVVKIANKYKIPLFPISTGKNLGYGSSAPNRRGDVIVDLKRMNKILEVDDNRNFCIVEPGVSYFDLYKYIEDNKLNVMMDIPDPGWGSPIGNALDHGWGYLVGNFRDHFGSHCGMEVVLANGEVMRTGMGALPNAKTFAENKYGYGPYVDGLFAQSNFGIVTKMGFWMMPKPKAYALCSLTVPGREDIIKIVDVLNYLEDSSIIGWPLYRSPLNPPYGEPMNEELQSYLKSKDGRPDLEKIQNYALKNKIPYWQVDIPFYGNEDAIKANIAEAKEMFSAIKGYKLETTEFMKLPLTQDQAKKMKHKVSLGIPNMEIFWLSTRGATTPPSDGHVWFSPILPRDGKELLKAQEVFIDVFRELGMEPQITPFSHPRTWMYRAFCFMLGFGNSRSDIEHNKQVRKLMKRMIEVAAENGWGDYRAAPAFQDQISDTYSFNNHILKRFSEQLKDAIDPNGILAPGRGGIWPKHLRGKK